MPEVLTFEEISENIEKLKQILTKSIQLCLKEKATCDRLISLQTHLPINDVSFIYSICRKYDYSPGLPYNGYRSVLTVFNKCVLNATKVCENLLALSLEGNDKKLVKAKLELIAADDALKLSIDFIDYAINMQKKSSDEMLIVGDEEINKELYLKFQKQKRTPFYGLCRGLHYPEKCRRDANAIAFARALFGKVYFGAKFLIFRILLAIITILRFIRNPSLIGKQLEIIDFKPTEEVLGFVKASFALSEKITIFTFQKFRRPKMAIDKIIDINETNIKITKEKNSGKTVNVPLPSAAKSQLKCRHLTDQDRKSPLSPVLIIQIHGGAFITLSSESAEVYLCDWVKQLKAPMFCIDYTLAPDAKFPQQIDEIMFAYCWALNHAEELGSTADQVIVMGDSAGGMLGINLVQKCIERGIRRPDGLFILYPVVELFDQSPSKILKVIDPLLSYSMTRAMDYAYAKEAYYKDRNNIYLSPLFTSENMLSQFPATTIVATDIDFLLDDSIDFAKLLRNENVNVSLNILTGVPHGYPYFKYSNSDCGKATHETLLMLKQLINQVSKNNIK